MKFFHVFLGKRRKKWLVGLGVVLTLAIVYWASQEEGPLERKIADVTLIVKVNSLHCEAKSDGMALSLVRVVEDSSGILKEPGRVVGPFPGRYVIISCDDAERELVKKYGDSKFFQRTYFVRLKSNSDSAMFGVISVIPND